MLATVLSAAAIASASTAQSDSGAGQEKSPRNILLLVADDIGVEALSVYGIGVKPAKTPVLDALSQRGLVFTSVWSQPTCSPTRATMLTGRYGFRTGVGLPTGGPAVEGPLPAPPQRPEGAPREFREDLSYARANAFPWSFRALARERRLTPADRKRSGPRASEVGLAAAVRALPAGYTTAALGKWHLADRANGWLDHPKAMGFDYYSVVPGNALPSYFAWVENEGGVASGREGYAPREKLAQAKDWIAAQGRSPWLLWYAFHLPHTPYFRPSSALDFLEGATGSAEETRNEPELFDLMVQEMDRMIGELLGAMEADVRDNTVVIFVGDNGTARGAIDPPFHPDRSKFSLYQGGIHVPLIVAGPGVAEGAKVEALANTTDLFSTVLEIAAGATSSQSPPDSISLAPYFDDPEHEPLRSWAYADRLQATLGVEYGDYAIRDERYKLISSVERSELYDLDADPYETKNLLTAEPSAAALEALGRLQGVAEELHLSEGRRTPGLPARSR